MAGVDLAEVAAGVDHVGVGGVGGEAPDARVGLHWQVAGLPRLALVLGALDGACVAEGTVAVAHEQHLGVVLLQGHGPAVHGGEGLLHLQGTPALAEVGAGENLLGGAGDYHRRSATGHHDVVDVGVPDALADVGLAHGGGADGRPAVAAVEAATHSVDLDARPDDAAVVGVDHQSRGPGLADVGAALGQGHVHLLPSAPSIAGAEEGAGAAARHNRVGVAGVHGDGPHLVVVQGAFQLAEADGAVIAAEDALLGARVNHAGVRGVSRQGIDVAVVPDAVADIGPALATVLATPDSAANGAYTD